MAYDFSNNPNMRAKLQEALTNAQNILAQDPSSTGA